MKKILRWTIFILAFALVAFGGWYVKHKDEFIKTPYDYLDRVKIAKFDHQEILVKDFPELSAQAVLVGEMKSGQIVYEKNSDTHYFPASLTKLMSAVVAVDNLKDVYTKKITVSEASVATEGDAGYLISGEIFYAKDLLQMALVMSANDAIVALADSIGYGRFVGLMNRKALELGLTNTGFFDPTGFDEKGNFSTAQDLFKLAKYIYANYPIIGELTRHSNINVYSINDKRAHLLISTNELYDKIPNFWLAKTGYTPNANECFLIIYPIGDSMFINIVLSSKDRFADTYKIYNWLKDNLKTTK